jgi:hypothetical protein
VAFVTTLLAIIGLALVLVVIAALMPGRAPEPVQPPPPSDGHEPPSEQGKNS